MNKKGQGACFAYTWDGIIRIWVGRVSCHITGRNTKFKNTVFSTGCGAIPECVAFDLPFKQGVRGSSPRWSTKRTATPFGVVVFSCRRGLESSSKAPAGLSSSSAHTGRYLYLRRSPARRKCMRVPAGAPKQQNPNQLFPMGDGFGFCIFCWNLSSPDSVQMVSRELQLMQPPARFYSANNKFRL